MEQNVTLQPEVKKPYNVFLMLAGIAIALYGLINMFSIIYENILEPLFSGYAEPYFHAILNNPISILTAYILPIIYSLVLFIFAIFLFIGKPNFVFPIFLGISFIYSTLLVISNFSLLLEWIKRFLSYSDSKYDARFYLYRVIGAVLPTIAEIILLLAIVIALIYSIMVACKKQVKILWIIPGIITVFHGIFELITFFYNIWGVQILSSILGLNLYINWSDDIFSILISFIMCFIASFVLILYFFFLGKGLSKEA